MKLETFMVYLAQSKSTLPNDGNFRENAHKAFDKYKQFISNQDPDLIDVYKNFDDLFSQMKQSFSAYTVRNYTHCFLIALTHLEYLQGVFSAEDIQLYSDKIRKALKEANKLCNEDKKKKKASQASSNSNDITKETELENAQQSAAGTDTESDDSDSEEGITLEDLEEPVNVCVIAKEDNDNQIAELKALVSELQQQIREDAIRITMLTSENEKLWALANAIVKK